MTGSVLGLPVESSVGSEELVMVDLSLVVTEAEPSQTSLKRSQKVSKVWATRRIC